VDLALIGKAVLALGAMGVIAGVLLSVASRRFHVEVDPRVEAVLDALPGANCGACGNPSCFALAEAMVAGTAGPDACIVGGQSVAETVASILGKETGVVKAEVCARHCGGGDRASRAYDYDGIRSCSAIAKMAGGPLGCYSGCIGFGDCVRACLFNAIEIDERGLPVISMERCTGCGACVQACPREGVGLLRLVTDSAPVVVRCSSHDKAKAKRSYCEVSCIGCKKCERECPEEAIKVVDFLAQVDYEKCTGCGTCVEVCPQRCIDFFGRGSNIDAVLVDGRGPDVDISKGPAQSKAD